MMTFIAGHLHKISCLITHQFTEKVGNRNKPAPHIEVPFPKMGEITHFLDDVTLNPLKTTDREWYSQVSINATGWE